MQRRTIRAIGAGVAIAALGLMGLTACSSSPASNEKVTLSYGIWDKNQEPAMQQIVSAFEKQNPNVKVNIELTANADYWTKLQTAASAGTAPDVFWMNGPNFQLYASNGQLAPLDNVKTSDYPKGLVDLYTYNGKVYGAPKDFDTIGVWYNKKLFDAAGVAYPKAGWTWDDFTADAKALTGKTPGTFGIAAPPYGQENFYDTMAQAGGYVVSPDGKKSGYDDPKTHPGRQVLGRPRQVGRIPDPPADDRHLLRRPLHVRKGRDVLGRLVEPRCVRQGVDRERHRCRPAAAGTCQQPVDHPRPGQRRLGQERSPRRREEVRRIRERKDCR